MLGINHLIILLMGFFTPSFGHYSTTARYSQNHRNLPNFGFFPLQTFPKAALSLWGSEPCTALPDLFWIDQYSCPACWLIESFTGSKEAKKARQISNPSPWSYLHLINLYPEVLKFFFLFFLCSCFGCLQGYWKIQKQTPRLPLIV